VPSSTSTSPSTKGQHKVLQRAQHPQVPQPDQNDKLPLNGILRHERQITLHHSNQARATISRTTHFHQNHYSNLSPNHPILQSAKSESPNHPSKSGCNKRRIVCWMTLAFHLGTSITPSYEHILLVGKLIKIQGSMEASRSSPVLPAGKHGQARPTSQSVCHAKNT
jgi:hypothetical protein